jgi:hypothetical protein
MLRLIEYSLLAVSLLVVVGLIVSGSRRSPESSATQPPRLGDDTPETPGRGKTI